MDDSTGQLQTNSSANQAQQDDGGLDVNDLYGGSLVAKEIEPVSTSDVGRNFDQAAEKVPLVERKDLEIGPEVRDYIEEEKKAELELSEKIVHEGKTLLASSEPEELPDLVLPMTEDAVKAGMGQKITSSAKWLAWWCVRIIKKFHGRVVYATSKR